MHSIDNIASLITEDPDILSELDASINQSPVMPSTPSPQLDTNVVEPEEVEMELGDEVELLDDPDQMDQLKAQEEFQQQQELDHQQQIQPQLDQLGDSVGSLQNGISQGQQSNQAGSQSLSNLDNEMGQIQQLLGKLQKDYPPQSGILRR